jgi:hypothetical protein
MGVSDAWRINLMFMQKLNRTFAEDYSVIEPPLKGWASFHHKAKGLIQ